MGLPSATDKSSATVGLRGETQKHDKRTGPQRHKPTDPEVQDFQHWSTRLDSCCTTHALGLLDDNGRNCKWTGEIPSWAGGHLEAQRSRRWSFL